MVGGDERLVDHHPARVLRSLDQQVGQRRDRHVRLVGAVQEVWKQQLVLFTLRHFDVALKCDSLRRRLSASSFVLYLQSRCFFFGPMISSVVALHTAFARPWKYESLKSNIMGFSNPVSFQTFFEI